MLSYICFVISVDALTLCFLVAFLLSPSAVGHDRPNQVLPRNHHHRLQSVPFLRAALVQDPQLVSRSISLQHMSRLCERFALFQTERCTIAMLAVNAEVRCVRVKTLAPVPYQNQIRVSPFPSTLLQENAVFVCRYSQH